MITLTCNSCCWTHVTGDFIRGLTVPCLGCGSPIQVPADEAAESADSDSSTPPADAAVDIQRCEQCGARRYDGDRQCRFCRERFASPLSGGAVDTRKVSTRGRVLKAAGIALCLAGSISSALWLTLGAEAKVISDEDRCQGNLLSLYEAVRRFEAGGLEPVPRTLGAGFWKAIAEKESAGSSLECPCAARSAPRRATHYRGPAKPWSELPDAAVILADFPGNHHDGAWILQKSGVVTFVQSGSPTYERALVETRE